MKIVYPYQTQSLGALGCDSKDKIQPIYDDAMQVRASIQAQLLSYGRALEQWIHDKFKNIESWTQPQYKKFRVADEFCYGNWRGPATATKVAYEEFSEELNDYLGRADVQAKILQIYGGGAGGGSASGGGFSLTAPSSPIIPGTSPVLNSWIIAGAVGVALFIGFKLLKRKQQ